MWEDGLMCLKSIYCQQANHGDPIIETNLVLHAEFALTLSNTTQSARISEHVIQGDLSCTRELVFTDFIVDNETTAFVQTANDGTFTKRNYVRGYIAEVKGNVNELWNSMGATTSTFIIGSRMTGWALLYASRKAPIAVSLNANSDESTGW